MRCISRVCCVESHRFDGAILSTGITRSRRIQSDFTDRSPREFVGQSRIAPAFVIHLVFRTRFGILASAANAETCRIDSPKSCVHQIAQTRSSSKSSFEICPPIGFVELDSAAGEVVIALMSFRTRLCLRRESHSPCRETLRLAKGDPRTEFFEAESWNHWKALIRSGSRRPSAPIRRSDRFQGTCTR